MGDGLLVLALGERVHGPEPFATALEALQPRRELVPLLFAKTIGRGLDREPQAPCQIRKLTADGGLAVPDLGDADLFMGERLSGLAQLRLQLVLACRELTELRGHALPHRLVRGQLLFERLTAGGDGGARLRDRGDQPLGRGHEGAVVDGQRLEPAPARGAL